MEQFPLAKPGSFTSSEDAFKSRIANHFENSTGGTLDKLRNFSRFVPRQSLSQFLLKSEIFKHVLNVHGHIIECGVFMGGGLFTWSQLSSIFEPYNHCRHVVGFDSFTGFPGVSAKDAAESSPKDGISPQTGTYRFEHKGELEECARIHDLNRPIGHIPKVHLVQGDATVTIPQYIEANPHLVVALLYLDFDLYEPTKVALQHFLPRMPKGSVIAFDELNQSQWPGETSAVIETVGLSNLRIQRLPHVPQISFAVL